jgi:hypothetical protein
MGRIRIDAFASLAGCLLAAGQAAAAPIAPAVPGTPISVNSMSAVSAGLPDLIDRFVPPPPLPFPSRAAARVAAGPGVPAGLAALRAAVLPAPSGDPFFDDWPARLAGYADGRIIQTRDVTAAAAPIMIVAVRQVTQLKYRTTDAHGLPSFATATLVVPALPWSGPGSRPVVVNNLAIDALGRDCTPGYTLAHGWGADTDSGDYLPPVTHASLLRGYAVLIPDHEGPRMAYAEPYVAGHAVLDAIRAARDLLPAEFAAAPFAMTGYSGGAIATYAAAKLIDSYAPELRGSIVGAAVGGVPADFGMLTRTMNGNWASAVFAAAIFGIGRERPEILAEMNHLAEWVATSPLKDQCFGGFAPEGVVSVPIDIAANIADPLGSGVAAEILRATSMADLKSGTPLFIYNGEQDWWIPAAGARELFRAQCALGVTAEYRDVPGEHVIGSWLGFGPAMSWVDDRLRGVRAPDNC